MNRGIKYLLALAFFLQLFEIKAQDPMFSQYWTSPLYMNPGLAGSVAQPRIIFNSRMQWAKLPNAFTTYSASADYLVDEWSSAFGVLVMTDKAGSANLRNTAIHGTYASKIRLSEGWVLSPAVTFGYGSRSIDFDKLVFGDQIIHNGQMMQLVISGQILIFLLELSYTMRHSGQVFLHTTSMSQTIHLEDAKHADVCSRRI
jgi:type IX secretion system PorP/SprF family membrane protein